ncbi:hypothetical protein STRCR_1276 [Streptococcus criceti HS-6]|uniref:Uncharacterized protein n=1 Tax=Streptococcus criceti HS-6 TaxID=873449 RepID=G5JML4_STRCG|nr:hypothetical protein STRCR_1276 [Streptococcus criceti HS-6]
MNNGHPSRFGFPLRPYGKWKASSGSLRLGKKYSSLLFLQP